MGLHEDGSDLRDNVSFIAESSFVYLTPIACNFTNEQ